MGQFDKPFQKPDDSPEDDFDISFLSPEQQKLFSLADKNLRDYLKRLYKEGVAKKGISEGERLIKEFLEGDKEGNEIMKSEIEEWCSIIENASTTAERRYIITAIMTIADQEKTLLHPLANSTTKNKSRVFINEIRAKFGLPPKYPV